ncbi:efflux RND transporter periplasmic adaptor subunit [Reinekea sp.]|jgi:multidrug efflux pump subunit AcrA (membrane-fusion protein)|uniref:efflux RND transporter periplasmic adaptor subunit n=1 Tax=Reinekea sp. TaxID=1970455 RepID=UPI002A8090D9|nr:biotin/lipoyl-binding protein [Reinekea sp.]
MAIRWRRWLFPLLVLVVGGALGSWLMSNKVSSVAQAEASVTVDPLLDAPTVAALAPMAQAYAPQMQLYSQLQSRQQVSVTSPASADVLAVRVQEGDSVLAGAVLVELDTRALTRQVDQLAARRQELNARRGLESQQFDSNRKALTIERNLVTIARRSVERLTDLKARNLTSAADMEAAERTYQNQLLALQNRELAIDRFQLVDQQYQAQAVELDSQLDQAKQALAEATISAPFAGRVSRVLVQVGAQVQSGAALLTLVDPDQQQLVAWAAASSLAGVDLSSGLIGTLALDTPNDAQNDAQNDMENDMQNDMQNQTIGVALSYVDPASDGGSLRLFFATEPGANNLVLNRYYRLWIDLPRVEAFAVPQTAVYSDQYVYRVEDDALVRVPVQMVGDRLQDGQLWRLVIGDLAGATVLATRLQEAAQGLAVRVAGTPNSLVMR